MKKQSQLMYRDLSRYKSLLVGILSDTHGYINENIHKRLSDCDVILHAGDIGSNQVINQLKIICKNVIPVIGNNDVKEKWNDEDHAELNKIIDIAEIKLPGGTIVIMHGDRYFSVANRHEKMRQHYPEAKAIIYGHSHKLVCDVEKNPWVLNPGAAGKTRTKGGASCLIMQANTMRWNISEFRATT